MYRYIVNWILAFMIIQVLVLYGRERRIKIQLPTRTTAVGQASMVTVQSSSLPSLSHQHNHLNSTPGQS